MQLVTLLYVLRRTENSKPLKCNRGARGRLDSLMQQNIKRRQDCQDYWQLTVMFVGLDDPIVAVPFWTVQV
jgi:hypothetical protein